ncbi:hypothetical protein RFI_35693, partial [Reticulomyxa filosa]
MVMTVMGMMIILITVMGMMVILMMGMTVIDNNEENNDDKKKKEEVKEKDDNKNYAHVHRVTVFETLAPLPTPLKDTQCIAYKNEIIMCGGRNNRNCYSYHTIKNKYKLICEYPFKESGHCVVKLVNNDNCKNANEMTLLSFGGYPKHTLVMKYISVWKNEDRQKQSLIDYNIWKPLMDSHNNEISIGKKEDDYYKVRAVIGGRNRNLLFITHFKNYIDVFDLNTFQFIKHDTLPSDCIHSQCFVSKSENMMLLFCWKLGLSIEYDEINNTFQYQELHVSKNIGTLCAYVYTYINDLILFFGGKYGGFANEIYQYSIIDNQWSKFKKRLPLTLKNCVGILNDDNKFIHVVGIYKDTDTYIGHLLNQAIPKHIKISTSELLENKKQWIMEKELLQIEQLYHEFEDMDKIDISFK